MRKKINATYQNRNERKSHHPIELKQNMVSRLNRIEGQIRGIARMIDNNVYCDDVLQQISSVESALGGLKTVLLEAHMKSCIIEQIRDGNDEILDELFITLRNFLK